MIIILYMHISDNGNDIQKYIHYHIIYEDSKYISITQSDIYWMLRVKKISVYVAKYIN